VPTAAVLIPVKAFGLAKARLAGVLSAPDRAALARSMAEQVVKAAGAAPVTVACDDDDVAAWARSMGAAVHWTPGLDLNGAVTSGVEALGAAGVGRVVVAHADLPDAIDLAALLASSDVTAVPDRRDDGTNVLSLPTSAGFCFAYGPGSFGRHEAEANRLGLAFHVLRLPELMHDVDGPDDL
jgi:2-phospho-L-lactate guanylyltransferase